VWVLSENEKAVEFYRALGGKVVARSSKKFGTRVLDKVAFGWQGRLLRPFPADTMRMWPISTRVNKPESDDPSIPEPIAAL